MYRAADVNLGRHVAIKVLPPSWEHDPDRVARFTREPKALASLNHPNVAALHGFERAGDRRALVMELVEGPTLADLIAKGAASDSSRWCRLPGAAMPGSRSSPIGRRP